MRFVDEHQGIGRKVINQGWRRFPGLTPGQIARIVFDAFAETQLVKHFQIKARALLDALRLDQAVLPLKKLNALAQLILDRLDRPKHGGSWRDVMR